MLPTQLARIDRLVGGTFAPGTNRILNRAARELKAYFEGELKRFSTPLHAPGTAFQTRVWEELNRIPYGATRSYAEVAAAIGRATAVRAVARANGDNRIAIMIPCHRVIGADGNLTGYGGGRWRKRRLLDLEGGGAGQRSLF
jgi:AraC family transcriptional regulator of adaptative response/methylated-DNA-[protein]-cysteine methyltransferase